MKSLLSISACALLTGALACATASARELDVATAKKTEVRHGQIGPRDTILFYAFNEQAAVLQLNIRHEGGKFSVGGSVRLFAEGTKAEDLEKWINNQHSCGLFPDVPEPVATHVLAADACSVLGSERKPGDPTVGPMGDKFEDHALKFKVADIKAAGFTLKGFTADTGAFLRVGPDA